MNINRMRNDQGVMMIPRTAQLVSDRFVYIGFKRMEEDYDILGVKEVTVHG
jgi:hypothetical protein